MKKVLITFVLLTVLIIGAGYGYRFLAEKYENPAGSQSGEPTDVTEISKDTVKNPAPDFTMTDIDGNELTLSSLYGKPIVLNFWATWCGYCILEMADFQKVYDRYGDEFQFVMVNLTDNAREKVSTSAAFIAEKGFTFPIYFDVYKQALEAYEAYSIPRTYIIDENGSIVESRIGALDEKTLLSLMGY